MLLPNRNFVSGPWKPNPQTAVLDPNDPINKWRIGCWLLGDVLAGRTRDLSRYGANGTLTPNSGTFALAKSHHGGLSLSYSGTAPYVDIPRSDAGFLNATGLTYVCWGYLNSLSGYNMLITKAASNGATNNPGELRIDASTGVINAVRAHATDYKSYNSTATLSTGKFYQIICAFPDNLLETPPAFFINNVATPAIENGGTGSGPATGSNADIWLGYRQDNVGDLNGYLEGVSIFGKYLTASERARLYAEPYAGIYEAAPRWRVGSAGGGAVALAGKTRYVMAGRGSRTGAASLHATEKSRLIGRVPVRGATSLIGKERSAVSARGSRIGSTTLHGRLTAAVRALASRTGTTGIVARARIALRGRGSRTGIAHLAGRAAAKLSGGLSKSGMIALIARALMRVSAKGSRAGTATLKGHESSAASARGAITGKASLHGQSRSRLSIAAKGLFSRKLSARSQYRVVQKGNMVRMVPLHANMMTLTYARGSRTGTVQLSAVARLMARLRAALRGPVQHLAPDPKYTVTQQRAAPFTATQQRPATFEVGE